MLHQSQTAKGHKAVPLCFESGDTATAIFDYTFSTAFTADSDILELGMIPAETLIVGATVIGEGLGAITANIGVMDGDFGAKDDTRDLTTDLLFKAQSVNDTEQDATKLACICIAPSHTHRGLGVKLSGDVAAGAAKKITVVLQYVA